MAYNKCMNQIALIHLILNFSDLFNAAFLEIKNNKTQQNLYLIFLNLKLLYNSPNPIILLMTETDQTTHQQSRQNQNPQNFIPLRQHHLHYDQDNFITLDENPEFGLTFGRPQAQLINQLFDTPPTKIHTKLNASKIPSNNQNNQRSFPLRDRARSALQNKLSSKQFDLEKLRQNMSRITYSIKTIECRNEQEIGVTSRRVVMGNKLLETQKNFLNIKFNTNRSRCSSYSNRIQFNDENQTQESRFSTQKPSQVNPIISHNKFHSKRLNVIVKRKKSNFPKELQNSSNSLKNFSFNLDNEQNSSKQLNTEANCEESNIKSIEGTNKITFRQKKQNRPPTIQNKRLKYETLMAKKSSQLFRNNQGKVTANFQNKIPFGENLMLPNQGQLMSERKRKVSLSNILSQYHTQIIENSNNVLIQRSNLCQPLKELFKNKFSTISKTVHDEGKNMLEKNLIKIKMRKHSLSKREFGNKAEQGQQDRIATVRKFRKYEEIQKENACLMD